MGVIFIFIVGLVVVGICLVEILRQLKAAWDRGASVRRRGREF